jgi:hypothetical protein
VLGGTPAALPLRKTRYPFDRTLGGSHSWSGRVRKISPPSGFDPRTVLQIRTSLKDFSELAHPPLISRALKVKMRILTSSWRAYNWQQFVTKLETEAALEQESFHNYVCIYYSNLFALQKVNDLRHRYVVNWGVWSDICSLISCWVRC